jgi:hypothetical protein
MLHRALLGLLLVTATAAHALTLDSIRVKATLIDGSSKDPFRIRGRLTDGDARAIVKGFAMIRFGELEAQAPAGSFVRRGNAYVWKSYLFGVKKVSINVKKGTIDVVGGGLDLGDMPGPVTLAIGTSKGVVCGSFDWTGAQVTRGLQGGRVTRKTAVGPLDPCFDDDDGEDHQAPSVLITTPTPLSGIATTSTEASIGGEVSDDVGVTGLTWESDQGAGGSLAVTPTFSIPNVALVPGDNRITVSATDAAGNTGTDVLVVTYNTNGLEFDGVPVASPEALISGDSANVSVRQKILANLDLDPATIEIVHLNDDGTTTSLTGLKDDGNRQLGDDLPGDDVYSGLMGVESPADSTGEEHFRVGARTKSAPDVVAWSPVLTIPRVAEVKVDAIKAAITLADNAKILFTSLRDDGMDDDSALVEVGLLARASGALATGPSTGKLGAWWVTKDGLLGGMLGYDQSSRRGAGSNVPSVARTKAPSLPHSIANAPAAITNWTEVGSRRTLVLAPFFSDAEPLQVDGMLRGLTCPQYDVETLVGEDAGADRFKNLEEYGLILIASHGDTLFEGIGDALRPEWSWKSNGGQAVVLTGTVLDSLNIRRWQRDLRLGRMAIFPGGTTGVLPTFFTQYSVRLPASIVYVGSCRSSANASLASALLERGAAAYLGYDGYVDSAFASQMGVSLFSKLLEGQPLSQAFTPGQQDGQVPPSTFTLGGDDAMSLATGPIVNRSFEVQSGFLASVAGFTVKGDGRIIGELGITTPTDGARMALVSTGLGLTTESGSFSQEVCLPPLPPGKTTMKLEYDWNFFSEEFLEYCGSQYQDFFQVSFGDTVLQSTKVDDLCNEGGLIPDDVDFDKGDVYRTGWRTQSVDITALAGTTATLTFAAGDVGDSIFDTVILVDNARIVTE